MFGRQLRQLRDNRRDPTRLILGKQAWRPIGDYPQPKPESLLVPLGNA
jgi:hypothetical protein